MNDSPKVSRRDWLRLRKPNNDHWLGETGSPSHPDAKIEGIESPPNHGGIDLADLPPLREAALDNEEVNALLNDIGVHGKDVQLMQRRRPSNVPASNHPATAVPATTLEAAKTAFLAGTVQRLQVRYRWNNELWIDTLEQQGTHTRLVRVSHKNM